MADDDATGQEPETTDENDLTAEQEQELQKAAEADESADQKPPVDEFDAERARAAIAKRNSENASLRKRLKELEPLAAKAKELEDAKKTEAERLNERSSAAERRAEEAERRALLLEVAAEKGLTVRQANRLRGSTREELEADADEYLAENAPKVTPASKVATKPTEKLRGGTDPEEPVEETDPRKLADLITRRRH
jgi:hypothetical protein